MSAPAELARRATARSVHATLYRFFGDELSELLDTVLAGDVVSDRATAERLVRSLGALAHLHKRHFIDARGGHLLGRFGRALRSALPALRCCECTPPRTRQTTTPHRFILGGTHDPS